MMNSDVPIVVYVAPDGSRDEGSDDAEKTTSEGALNESFMEVESDIIFHLLPAALLEGFVDSIKKKTGIEILVQRPGSNPNEEYVYAEQGDILVLEINEGDAVSFCARGNVDEELLDNALEIIEYFFFSWMFRCWGCFSIRNRRIY